MDAVARQLEDRVRDLLRVVRMVRQRHHALPPGLIGTLGLIDRAAANPAGTSGCHAKELATSAGLDPSTVSRAVAALVANGLVERRADPADGRASILVVTERGHAELADARDWYDRLLGRALADWSPEEVEALTRALGRLTTDVEGALGSTLEAAR
ncbi:MarR family transcriptional regulator [Saccharothrix sp. NRRL B-16348]|jgi:DNA-binding MarR family transcriptional regulator|uniref:MarR family winged helix-turn-helix transcriptional regulator n=1 Tax=Saccharothrix sp. NRRL B-16348 TaxID=1415542 RepID=UPI0006AEDD01|nr:MarR family winged helix-turn-helix transcriptional regulator [Saccharothrix sp. NRRL B-16348]KOX28736.1 MarR family transcriptional regulator [Saccharothrix sp. NRRL B-16348]